MLAVRCIVGWAWAAGMLLAGAWLWQQRHDLPLPADLVLAIAVMAAAGALFVFMAMVADELIPTTPTAVRGLLKLFVGVLWWLMFLQSGYLGWRLLN